jgi:RNA polymerase sigma factor for flagellar operon FliA
LDYHLFLVQHLTLVEKVVRFVSRRHHLSMGDADEFASLVRFKLVDHDCAILRKFEGRSALNTYLTVVIDRLCLDFLTAKWGKWRPSAAARRLGSVAILLEHLIVRDGMTFDEAVGTLQTNHGVSHSRGELHELLLQLPTIAARGRHGDLADPPYGRGGHTLPTLPDENDDFDMVVRIQEALNEAIAALGPDERRLIQLRFEQGMPVVDIARKLGVRTKPLYRRLEHIIRGLRSDLQRRGIQEREIARIVGHPTLALSGILTER